MIIRLSILKLADSVFAKMFPPSLLNTAVCNFLSLKYSLRSVNPNQLTGSRFRYMADPHQLSASPNLLPSFCLKDATVPLYPTLNLEVTVPNTTRSNWLFFVESVDLPPRKLR